MASCFAAYVRKMKALEIMPLLDYSTEELQDKTYETIKEVAKINSLRETINKPNIVSSTSYMPIDVDDNIFDHIGKNPYSEDFTDGTSNIFPFL
jgi:hypothetical protein